MLWNDRLPISLQFTNQMCKRKLLGYLIIRIKILFSKSSSFYAVFYYSSFSLMLPSFHRHYLLPPWYSTIQHNIPLYLIISTGYGYELNSKWTLKNTRTLEIVDKCIALLDVWSCFNYFVFLQFSKVFILHQPFPSWTRHRYIFLLISFNRSAL